MKTCRRLLQVVAISMAMMFFLTSAWGEEQSKLSGAQDAPAPLDLEVLSDPISADLRKFLAPALRNEPIDVALVENLIRAYYRIHGQPDMKLSSLVDEETGLVLIHLENPHVPAKSWHSYGVANPGMSQEVRDRRQEPLDSVDSAHLFWQAVDKLGQVNVLIPR
jgi:hypothetical protein